jgi:capsid assembly protease
MPKPGQLTCRAEQLAGPWLCESGALEAYEQAVRYILDNGQLQAVAAASALMDEDTTDEDAQRGYALADGGIARIPVEGVLTKYPTSFRSQLGGTSTLLLQRLFAKAANDPAVKGILVECDSPGGTVNGIQELSAGIQQAAAVKPVHFHVHGQGCSAMYWLMAAGNHITADPSAMVGSVGAKVTLRDTSELFKKQGITATTLSSGPDKVVNDPGVPIAPLALARVQAWIDQTGQSFVNAVAKMRKLAPEQQTTVARAGFHSAVDAKALGLIDAVGFTNDALEIIRKKTNPTGQLSRSGGQTSTKAAEYTRRATMLTAEQLAQAKLIPGCGQITAENADSLLLQAASSLQNVLTQEINRTTQLTHELATKSTASTGEAPATPRELAMAAQSARTQLNALANIKLTEAVATELAGELIGADGKLNAQALTPDARGITLASRVLNVLAKNDLSNQPRINANGQITGAQPIGRTAPGAGEGGVPAYTQEAINAIRQRSKLPPVNLTTAGALANGVGATLNGQN